MSPCMVSIVTLRPRARGEQRGQPAHSPDQHGPTTCHCGPGNGVPRATPSPRGPKEVPQGWTELRKSSPLAGTPTCSWGSVGRPTVTGQVPHTPPSPARSCRPHALCGDPVCEHKAILARRRKRRFWKVLGCGTLPLAVHTLFRKVGWVPRASCDGDSSERASCLVPSHSPSWSQRVPCPARTPHWHLSSPQCTLSSGGPPPPPRRSER